jgi:hypothetical protein
VVSKWVRVNGGHCSRLSKPTPQCKTKPPTPRLVLVNAYAQEASRDNHAYRISTNISSGNLLPA